MTCGSPQDSITIRDLESIDDLRLIEAAEKDIWRSDESDLIPLTLSVAAKEAGAMFLGAFDGGRLAGFAFAILGHHNGELNYHSHMVGVLDDYRNSGLGYRLKLAQRERALIFGVREEFGEGRARIKEITWTFDPLQSRNAHLNFAKLGVVSNSYRPDFYGPQTTSALHQNGTDRLWVRWPIASRRVKKRIEGERNQSTCMEALSVLKPLVAFDGTGRPARGDAGSALAKQRAAIEIPADIAELEAKDRALAGEWRMATRWAFQSALANGFFVAEFCRGLRGQQGPGVFLLEKGTVEDYVPELRRR